MDFPMSLSNVLLVVLAASILIAVALWAYADARKRGKSGLLVALLVLLAWPVGLITWLVFRPKEN